MNYKVTVYVMTPYYTVVEDVETEEEAVKIALERQGPAMPSNLYNYAEEEWVADGVCEFPNLGKDEKPEVEEN